MHLYFIHKCWKYWKIIFNFYAFHFGLFKKMLDDLQKQFINLRLNKAYQY